MPARNNVKSLIFLRDITFIFQYKHTFMPFILWSLLWKSFSRTINKQRSDVVWHICLLRTTVLLLITTNSTRMAQRPKIPKFGMLETKNLIYLIQCSKCQEMPVHRFAERPNANLVNDLDNTADPSWTGNINSVIPLLSPHILTKLDIHSTTSF